MATGAVGTRCQQGYALRNRVISDRAQVQSVAKLITSIDPSRAPRRFAQAKSELDQKKRSLIEGQRWLVDHDKHCPICGVGQ